MWQPAPWFWGKNGQVSEVKQNLLNLKSSLCDLGVTGLKFCSFGFAYHQIQNIFEKMYVCEITSGFLNISNRSSNKEKISAIAFNLLSRFSLFQTIYVNKFLFKICSCTKIYGKFPYSCNIFLFENFKVLVKGNISSSPMYISMLGYILGIFINRKMHLATLSLYVT